MLAVSIENLMETQLKVAILLPTFNGEKYLAEQLDSLLGQSYQNYIIVLRDDCSTDGTVQIIQSYLTKYPEFIHFLDSGGKNLGAGGSFSLLMRYVLDHKKELGLQQAYMLFCDQDDIWLEDKISVQFKAMLEAESTNAKIPILVHSDLQVVSETGQLISESFVRYQGLKTKRNRFNNLLVSNLVTGCAVLVNENLAKRSLPVPDEAIMHDWWVTLVCSAFGKLVFLDRPLVDYRQHETNTLGAKEYPKPDYSNSARIREILSFRSNPLLEDCATQAEMFSKRYGTQLTIVKRCLVFFTVIMRLRIGLLQKLIFRLMRGF